MQLLPTCIHFLMQSMWRKAASVLQVLWSSPDTPVRKHDGTMCALTASSIVHVYTRVYVCHEHSCNTTVHRHLHSVAALEDTHLPPNPNTHKSQQNTASPQIQWKACLLTISAKTTGCWSGGVDHGWCSETISTTAGAFIISHCKGARWDNWSPKLNVQHAFLMSLHRCSFNI